MESSASSTSSPHIPTASSARRACQTRASARLFACMSECAQLSGICADIRLSEGGIVSVGESSNMPSRESVWQRTGGERCSWPEFEAAHTLWIDDS
eukprot:5893137-Pleurochrysis_carterae.AAC.1